MATGIQGRNHSSSWSLPSSDISFRAKSKVNFSAGRGLTHHLTTGIHPFHSQQPCTLSQYSIRHLTVSLGSSLFELAGRCLDVAKETLLMKADDFSKWVYDELKDVVPLHAKTPFEIDYVHDKTFWLAHFCSAIEELSSCLDPQRLEGLQDLVWAGLLSPHQYEEGLKSLTWPFARVHEACEKFRATLKNCPVVIEKGLHEDLRRCLKTNIDLKDILDYYRILMNPLDYKEALSAARTFLQKHKGELSWTQKTYKSALVLFNEAIDKTDREVRKNLKQERACFNRVARDLPFYFAEINSRGVWADVKETVPVNENSIKIDLLMRCGKKGFQYISTHPLQAITAILATQVAATAALQAFAKPKERRNPLHLNNKAVARKDAPKIHDYGKRALGDVFLINPNTTNSQAYPSLATLSNGNVCIVWLEANQTIAPTVYGKIMTANGTAVTGEFPISQDPFQSSTNPVITALNNTNAFVAWANNVFLYGRIVASNGTAIANEFIISRHEDEGIALAALNNGDVFVIWQILQGGDSLYGRIFTSNGTAITDQFLISQNGQSSMFPSVAALNNAYVVVWEDESDVDVYYRIIGSNGTALTDPFRINQDLGQQSNPTVLALNNDEIFISWMGDQTGNNEPYGMVIAPNGTILVEEFLMNQTLPGRNLYNIYFTRLNQENIFVGLETQSAIVYGKIVFGNGTAVTNAFLICQNDEGLNFPITFAALNNGNIFAVWADSTSLETSTLYGRILTLAFMENPNITSTTTTTSSSTGLPATSGSTTTGTGTSGPSTTGHSRDTSSTGNISPPGVSTELILGIAGGVGGVVLIIASGILMRKYCLSRRSKRSSRDCKPLLKKVELRSSPTNLFLPSEGGFTTRPTVMGSLNKTTFALWEQISATEASSLEKILYRKIPFTADSSGHMPFYLGKGQFGKTFLASNVTTKEWVAVKKIQGEQHIKESLQEGQLQNKLEGSQHIMPLLDYLYFTPSEEDVDREPYLFQFMPIAMINGIGYKALMSSLEKQDPALHQRLLTTHMYQLLKGLTFMHDQWIYHSDIKDANILFMPDFTLKIADFGRALELGRRGIIQGEQALGDRRKFAPEQIAYIRYFWKKEGINTGLGEVASAYAAAPADLWSGGLFILETLAGNEPFNESIASFKTKVTKWTNASFQKVIDQEKALQDASTSTLSGVIKKLLHTDPKKRVDVSKTFQWPIFKTMQFVNEKEGSDLLKKFLENPKIAQKSALQNGDPYAAMLQQERDAYYHYHLKS